MVNRGFSLIEVIIALTLLGVGMLSVAASGVIAARLQSETELHEEMLRRATSLTDSLVANRVYGRGDHPADRYRLIWTAAEETVSVQAVLADSVFFELESAR